MSDMPTELGRGDAGEGHGGVASAPSSTDSRITIDLDARTDESLGWLARWEQVSREQLLARMIEAYPRHGEQHGVSVRVSAATAARLTAAAATLGMSEEALIAEAIDFYSPRASRSGTWRLVGLLGLLLMLPVALMFASPQVSGSGSAAAWCIYAVAMAVCSAGAVGLIFVAIYAELIVIRYGVTGLVVAAGYGMSAVLSAFAYGYWLLSRLSPASFNVPMTRVDAVYFALGTFGTSGTGRLTAQSSLAELLSAGQVVLGWSFVAGVVALVVPRAAAAYRRRSNSRLIVRVEKGEAEQQPLA